MGVLNTSAKRWTASQPDRFESGSFRTVSNVLKTLVIFTLT